MKNFIGIDLGTTNSAICSYDGENVTIWKSPEQNDVTPSVISFDKRGNKYVGKRAYDSAPKNPQNSAQLFKRMMGTKTTVHIKALDKDLSPEECSAEVLKVLYGYLPEEIRNDGDTGTVITIPAAFNQMQKAATREAAQMAGIGSIAFMQEPVAAIMSVMKVKDSDGIFLIYDLGGGTLDIAVAESIGKKVNLLAHGGIAMCGGRDFDRGIFARVIRPWLDDNFNLPKDFITNPQYQSAYRLCLWAAEKAKIELSSVEESHISLTEEEIRAVDLDDNEIFLDIPLTRDVFNEIIREKVMESVDKVREIISKNNLNATDFGNIIFIGGPTNYKPLRDMVAFELGIPGVVDVNPMTAVAEGAAIYAESIDWNSQDRHRKNIRGQVSINGDALKFNYIARTSEESAKIAVQVKGEIPEGLEYQIDSMDTGWSSGRVQLQHGRMVKVALSQKGENNFKISVFDQYGGVAKEERIVIERTSVTIAGIPASHSIGVEVLKGLGDSGSKLEWLVQVGDSLPKKGRKTFKATQVLKANSADAINFKLWEGEIEEPVGDNRFIGVFAINGRDLYEGVIPAGADLICDYEMKDDGNISIEISVPLIGSSFKSEREFYSRQEAAVDYHSQESTDMILEEAKNTLDRIEMLEGTVVNEKLAKAREKVESAMEIAYSDNPDAEPRQEAANNIYDAKKLLYEIRKENTSDIRQAELANTKKLYEDYVEQYAKEHDKLDIQMLFQRAQNAVSRRDSSFDDYLEEIRMECYRILWQQDWFVIDSFKQEAQRGNNYLDAAGHRQLVQEGYAVMENKNIQALRGIVAKMYNMPKKGHGSDQQNDFVNIIRG